MEVIILADSWLLDGNCSVCRRQNYCHTQCKANKSREAANLRKAIMQAVVDGYKVLHKEDK